MTLETIRKMIHNMEETEVIISAIQDLLEERYSEGYQDGYDYGYKEAYG